MASPPLFVRRKRREARPKSADGEEEGIGAPVVVRKPAKGSVRNDSRPRSFKATEGNSSLLLRGEDSEISLKASKEIDRPTYSKAYLSELRNSTPATPSSLSTNAPATDEEAGLDVASKFGPQRSLHGSTHIPSATEVEEKKQRRARLAKEHGSEDFVALEDHDSDGEFKPQRLQVSTFLEKEKDTRLMRDDEDIAEGFEAFVDDPGKVTLSRRARREQERQEKESMRSMIAEAEDSSDESDSSAERNHAYETAQTSRGMDGLSLKQRASKRPQQPKEITPIPKLAAVLARFREGIQGLEYERARLEKRQADIQKEKVEIANREENIQRLLVETGEKFERLRKEADVPLNDRGLESLGQTPGP